MATPINKAQPMREAGQQVIDYLNGTVSPYMSKETSERKAADTVLQSNIDAEVERAKAAEKTLTDNLAKEVTRATAAEKVNTDAITAEATRAKASEETLQTNINTEYKRATGAESALSDRVGVVEGKFPIKTASIGDAQVSEAKLDNDLQTLLSFCKTLPDFAYGFSDSQTIPSGSSITVEIDFGKTFQEIPEVFPVAVCNTDLNVLPTFVKYSTTSKSYVKVYNGGTTNVTNLTVGYFAVAGR